MIIPEIFPDEFGPGYLMRLSILNRFDKTSIALAAMRKRLPTDQASLPAQIIAQSLQMTIENYCQKHTLLPVFRGITDTEDNVEHGSLDYFYAIKRFAHDNLIGGFKVCRCCVAEDLKNVGSAYFRRSHQLPGVTTCTRHDSKLNQLETQDLLNLNKLDLKQAKTFQNFQHPIIERFQLLLNKVAGLKYPLNKYTLQRSLRDKARSMGFNVKGYGYDATVSEFLQERLPAGWLKSVFPNSIKSSIGNGTLKLIDALLNGSGAITRTEAFMLAIAALHNTTNSAMQFLESHLSLCEMDHVPKLNHNYKEYWTSAEFQRVFIENDGNEFKIANEMGIHTSTVIHGLKIAKFPRFNSTRLVKDTVYRPGSTISQNNYERDSALA